MNYIIKKYSLRVSLISLAFLIVVSTIFFIHTKIARATSDLNYIGDYWNLPGDCSASPDFPVGSPDFTRDDSVVDFDWGVGSPATSTINSDCFAVRWTKTVNLAAGAYIFKAQLYGGERIYIDNNIIIDQWNDNSGPEFAVPVTLTAGNHNIKVEYYNHISNASIHFSFHAPLANSNTWGTDGAVNSMVAGNDGTLYIGGNFGYIGPNTGSGALVNNTTGSISGNFPQVDGSITDSVSDGNGGWYIGGSFTYINGVNHKYLAHILADGSLDSSWNPDVDNIVLSLARSNSILYVGGYFTTINGQERLRLASFNSDGSLNQNFHPTLNSIVETIATSDVTSSIFIGGYFTQINSTTRNLVAALDVNGNLTTWNPNVSHDNGYHVKTIAISSTTVYIGGAFITINDQYRSYIGAIDLNTGLPTDWAPNANSSVYKIVISSTTVYAGGGYSTIGGQNRNNLAALDMNINTNQATGWDPNPDNGIVSLAFSSSTVYVGGYFNNIGGEHHNLIAAIDATTGSSTAWNPITRNSVNVIIPFGSNVFLAGNFNSIGGKLRNYVAAVDSQTGQVKDWNPNANSVVLSLAFSSSTVYVGGYFGNIGGEARSDIAALDPITGVATDWNPGSDQSVTAMQANSSTLYVGGYFRNIGGQNRNRIAAFDIATGNVKDWNPNANDGVETMFLSGSTLYAGGYFRNIGGKVRNYIAALNTSDGNATDWDADASYIVQTIAASNSSVYVGGQFSMIGRGAIRNRIAELDAITGAATDWDPNANCTVRTLQVSTSTVYAGGCFSNIGGLYRNNMAELNRNINSNQATDWNPNPSGSIYSSALFGDKLYIGGDFNYVESLNLSFASFDNKEVQFSNPSSSGAESVSSVEIPISINQSQGSDVTVHYSVTGGTATGGGVDYLLAAGTAIIPAGQTSTNISMNVVNDTLLEGNETVVITLSDPSYGFLVGANKNFTYTIQDDDFLVYASNDVTSTPSDPGTLVLNNYDAAILDSTYLTTALSITDGGYDSQVFKFKPDLTGIVTSTFRTSWTGHGDVPEDKLVHIYIWNFDTLTWEEIASQHCSTDCTLVTDKTGNEYHDGSGNVWVWAKADNQAGAPIISDVNDNTGLLPITWNTNVSGTSYLAYDTISHANGSWNDYASHLSNSDFSSYHALTPPLYGNTSRSWQTVGSSASGTVIAVGTNGNDIYISHDSGNTWVDSTSSGGHYWRKVIVSDDGTKMAAFDGNTNYIYTSADSGATWSAGTRLSDTNGIVTIAASGDGKTLITALSGGGVWIATSTDGENFSWSSSSSPAQGNWTSVTASNDGQKLTAFYQSSDIIYTSNNGGQTWSPQDAGLHGWWSAAASGDGLTLIAVDGNSQTVWTATSSDGISFTWTNHPDSPGQDGWQSTASSYDGQKLAVVSNSNIFTSTNGGSSWTNRPVPATNGANSWQSIASSADGDNLVAVIYNGNIFTSTDSGVTWVDKTGTQWYYRVRSATADGDTTTSPEYSLRFHPTNSCPFVFTYDGSKYNFVVDASNSGNLSSGLDRMTWANTPFYKDPNTNNNYPFPISHVSIPHGALVPRTENGETYYDVKTATELNETNYYDNTALEIVDHNPNIMVYPDWRNNGLIHSISKNAPAPISVIDQDGKNITDLVRAEDNNYWHSSMHAAPAYIDIKLVDSSTTPAHLKLVMKADKEGQLSNGKSTGDQLQYKNSSGQFVNLPADKNIFVVTRPGASHASRNLMNTYGIVSRVIDLSGLDIKDNTIRLVITNSARFWNIDWMAVDTSADGGFTITTETPYYADLHQRGVSKMVMSNPSDPYMIQTEPVYDQLIKTFGGGNPLTGYATKYGDVLPLLSAVDNKFVIMVQGDELGLKYRVPAQTENTERDFIYYSWDWHKPFIGALGDTILPLPFNEMTQYPYHTDVENYPVDAEHQAYQDAYNTRSISWGTYPNTTSSLHHSLNTDFISVVAFAQSGPAISDVSTTVVNTTATINWITDINASTKIYYSPDISYSSSTIETDIVVPTTSHSVELTGLVECTTYHYKVLSTDNANRISSSTGAYFTTGCTGGVTVSSQTEGAVTTTLDESTSLTSNGHIFTVNTPANFTATSSQITVQIKELDSATVLGIIGKPSNTWINAGNTVFDIKALIDSQSTLDSFSLPVSISYNYSNSDISGLDEGSLWLYHYHNGAWEALTGCIVNANANTITCDTSNFSTFALFGRIASTPAPQGGGGGGGGGGAITAVAPVVYSPTWVVEGLKPTTQNITLNFFVNNASQTAISEDANFTNSSWENYIPSKIFTLSKGLGEKTIYLKFKSRDGGVTPIYQIKLTLTEFVEKVAPVVVPVVAETIPEETKSEIHNPESNITISLPKKLQYAPNSYVYYVYQYKNTTAKTQKIKIVRQVLDVKNKAVHTADGTRVINSGKSFKFNASSLLIKSLRDGIYTVKIKILDAKTNKVLDENGFNITVKKPVQVKVIKKIVVPVKKK